MAEVTFRQRSGRPRTDFDVRKDEPFGPGTSRLADEVKGLPEFKATSRVDDSVWFADAESVERLSERTDDATLRAAGSTTLLDANVPPDDGYQLAEPSSSDEPA